MYVAITLPVNGKPLNSVFKYQYVGTNFEKLYLQSSITQAPSPWLNRAQLNYDGNVRATFT